MFTSLSSDDPQQIGGYRLRARLGFGGMGQVYLSFTPGGRPLALKVVRREYADDRDFRRRFAEEVRAAQRVNGVYTAQLVDAAAPEAEVPWLASAYVAGPTLRDAVQDHGPLPVGSVRPLIAAVAMSLHAIHSAGVVHRDLTPGNVVLAADGPRVIDFGIARAVDATHLTLSHTPIGTPSFMAPEQANGLPLTPAADVFSLGAVAYFAATNRTAFGDGNFLSVLRRVAEAEADLTDCPAELRGLVEACLRREPGERPSTTDVVEACGGVPRFTTGWLPRPVAADAAARSAAVAALAAEPPEAVRVFPGVPSTGATGTGAAAVSRRRRGPLVAFATVLVLLLGVAGGVAIASILDPDSGTGQRDGLQDGAVATPGGDAPGTSGPPSRSPSPSATPSPTAEPGPAVQWTGKVRIARYGVDLDPVPPERGDLYDLLDADVDLGLVGDRDSQISGVGTGLATWPGDNAPSHAECTELLLTQGVGALRVTAGEVVCVATDEERVAVLTVDGIAKDFNTGFTATAKVWAPAGS
ncbi:serine/threonine-protein kinase [Plantactinospora sp. B5E13]|uniref:serine/threonine-protein kinase n=1 Tax=unclassified Plantactinospora TaxID=2631981 RepID=UPI00325F186D